MLIRRYPHELVTVDVCRMAAGEVFAFDQKGSGGCLAVSFANGVMAAEKPGAWRDIDKHGGLRTPDDWGCALGQAMTAFRAGNEDALWLCINENGSGKPVVEQFDVAGRFLVPAGHAVIVASTGMIVAGAVGEMGILPVPEQSPSWEINRTTKAGALTVRLYAQPIALTLGGGQAGEFGNYFAPSDEDVVITGNADILLVGAP